MRVVLEDAVIEMRGISDIANFAASLTSTIPNSNDLVGNKRVERMMRNVP